MKDSFILYKDFKEIFLMLEPEECKKLIIAIFEYEETGQEQELDKSLKLAFLPIKIALDKNREKYQKIVERNKLNGQKGGRPEKPKKPSGLIGNPKNPDEPKKADNDNDNDNVNDNINKKEIYKEKYGEFKNVLLTENELNKLKEQFSDYEEKINKLSVYIASKGVKYKSHYATILNWSRKEPKKQEKRYFN